MSKCGKLPLPDSCRGGGGFGLARFNIPYLSRKGYLHQVSTKGNKNLEYYFNKIF